MDKPYDEEGRPLMERRNFYLPRPLTDQLDKLSRQTGMSMSEHLRAALAAYLEEKLK